MRLIRQTGQFKKDLKKIRRRPQRDYADLEEVLMLLAQDAPLPAKLQDHALVGDWGGCRDCHIKPDWLLIYKKVQQELRLIRTGSHAELFG